MCPASGLRVPAWILLLLSPVLMFAQIRSGTIVGKVTDPTGAAMANTEVVVREVNTNQVYNLTTNDSGDYIQPYLPFGTYEVTVRKNGFKTITQTGLTLTTAQTIRADIVLEVGTVETAVSVTASAVELQTESSRVTNSVSEQVIKSIPNINNNPLNYAVLTQGVVARAAMNDTQSAQSFGIGTEGRRTFSNFQINGGAAFGNNIQLDGVSIQASAWNEVAVLPNTEGLAEVKTTINNMSAEYGRSQGTVILTTKSGTNEFHGSAQFRLRNEAFNANRFENNAVQPFVPRAPFKQQGYSATFGGPVFIPKLYNGKDKTFFFLSYEGFRFNQALDYFRTVPTAAERRGDFSQTLAQVGAQFVPVQVFDPYNALPVPGTTGQFRRMPFPNAIIPPSRINPQMAAITGEFPLPNRTPDDPTGVNNFFNRMTRAFLRDSINARLDHRLTRHSLYGTFGSNLGTIDSPNGWGPQTRAFVQQGGFIGQVNGDRNYYASVGDTWLINPTTVADIRVGLTRVAAQNRSATYDDLNLDAFGIPREMQGAPGLRGAWPEVTNFGGGWSRISPLNQTAYLAKVERQTNWNIVGSVTKTVGRWTHKWGGEFRNYLSNYSDARGSFWLRTGNGFTSGNLIGLLGQNIDAVTAERQGSGLASYLLGVGDIQAGENAVLLALSAKYMALYSQSDWRATDRLTVNLGLRYDIQPGPTERYNRVSSFSFRGTNPFGAPGNLIFPGQDGVGRNLYQTPWDNWGPRVGLAYRVTDSWVVRSGFGVTYTPSNTGYFGGPYYFGAQNFVDRTNDPTAGQYGPNPAGSIVAPYNRVTQLIPAIGANRNAPQYYGAGDNEPRFDYDDMKNGKILQWNFFVERKIGRDWLAQVGYSGARGYHLQMGRWNVNTDQELPDSLLQDWRAQYIASNGTNPATLAVPNRFNPAGTIPFNGVFRGATVPARNAVLPLPLFPNNLLGAPVGFYTYNALMAQLQKSFSNGLLFNVHYTWSRTIELWGSEAQNNNYAENAGLQTFNIDRRNLSNNYSISPNDIPHRVVATWVWTPPVGRGKRLNLSNSFANAVFGGWNVGGVLISQSGQPQQGFGGPAGAMNSRGDRLSGVPIEVPKELQRWYTGASVAERTVTLPSGRQVTVCRYCFLKYSVDAFRGRVVQLPNGNFAPDIYWFGTADNRYGDIRGNGRFNINLSLQKEFAVKETVRFQLSAEASNVLNNTQFRPNMNGGLGNTFVNVSAAQAAAGIRPGMVQNDNFGTWGMATFDPRQVEFRLRVFF
jgi:hypothetical protein